MIITSERDMGCPDLEIKYKDKRAFGHQCTGGNVIRIVRRMTAGTGIGFINQEIINDLFCGNQEKKQRGLRM